MSAKISNKKYKDAEATQLFPDDLDAVPRARRDLPVLLALLALSLLVYLTAAALIDPYKVFHIIDFNKRNFELSARYNKIEYLKKNPKQGFIFGTSRANGLPVDVARSLTGLDFYNMTSPGDTYKGTYQKVKWVLENQPARHLILSLDYSQAMGSMIMDDNLPLIAREHPEVSGQNGFAFYWSFFWAHPKVFAFTVHGNLVRKGTWWWWDQQTGHYHFLEKERDLKENPERLFKARAKVMASLLAANPSPEPTTVNLEKIAWINKALELAKSKGVATTVILNPNYPGLHAMFGEDNYTKMRKAIATNIKGIWDFGAYAGATCEDANWFDTSHYTFSLGDIFLNIALDPDGEVARNNPAIVAAVEESKNGIFEEPNRCDD